MELGQLSKLSQRQTNGAIRRVSLSDSVNDPSQNINKANKQRVYAGRPFMCSTTKCPNIA